MGLLEVSDIQKTEDGKLIIDGISFVQRAGQHIAISGESGAGKTTLLRIIAGLTQPDGGEVLFDGKRVEGPLEKLIPGHQHIAYLSQHFELRNHYRVEEILDMANRLPDNEAMNIYRVCRVDHLLKRWTSQLSGGEKQRISLAALLGSSPRMLLLDEPFSNLDPIHKNILRGVINDISKQLDITCLLTSHEPADTLSWAHEVMVIQRGKIVQQNTPEAIYSTPVNDYVAGMFGRFVRVTDELTTVFPQISSLSKKYLRPEDFRITSGDNAARLTVISSRFLGGCYEVEADAPGTMIVLRAPRHYSTGDTIGVELVG